MRNGQNGRINQPPDLPENYAARLAVIAGAITTLGDGLSTIAATLALQEASQENGKQDQKMYSKQIEKMQKQMDQLASRIDKLERYKKRN